MIGVKEFVPGRSEGAIGHDLTLATGRPAPFGVVAL